jgi:hypothetical protein
MGASPELRGPMPHWHYDTFRATLGDGRSAPVRVQFRQAPSGLISELVLPFLDEAVFVRQ